MMKIGILRRKGLGKGSTTAIVEKMKHDVQVFMNTDEGLSSADVWIRWGCTSFIPKAAAWNKAQAIHIVNNKAGFRKLMQEHIDFVQIPQTWFSFEDLYNVLGWSDKETKKFILRPQFHSQGQKIYLGIFEEIVDNLIGLGLGEGQYYISEYIPKEREFRVYVAFGKVVCVAEKNPKNKEDIAWNQSQGSSFKNIKWGKWPLEACRMAINACILTELDFGGVDVIEDADGKPYVLEVNSAPTLTSEYRQQCFAQVFDYEIDLLGESKSELECIVTTPTSWKDVIHHGIWD